MARLLDMEGLTSVLQALLEARYGADAVSREDDNSVRLATRENVALDVVVLPRGGLDNVLVPAMYGYQAALYEQLAGECKKAAGSLWVDDRVALADFAKKLGAHSDERAAELRRQQAEEKARRFGSGASA